MLSKKITYYCKQSSTFTFYIKWRLCSLQHNMVSVGIYTHSSENLFFYSDCFSFLWISYSKYKRKTLNLHCNKVFYLHSFITAKNIDCRSSQEAATPRLWNFTPLKLHLINSSVNKFSNLWNHNVVSLYTRYLWNKCFAWKKTFGRQLFC